MSERVELVSKELDYKTKRFSHSQPLYSKITPQSGGTSVTPLVGAPVGPVSFTIPASCLNLAKSYLEFRIMLTKEATKFINVHGNLVSVINRMTLSTIGSNTILADLPYCSNWADSINVFATSYDDYLNKPSALATLNETSSASSALTPVEDIACSCSATANPAPIHWTTGAGIASTSSNPAPYAQYYDNPRYIYSSPTVNTDEFITVRLPLSVFKFTACSLDNIMYFGGLQLQLDIYFEAGTKWAFTNATTTNRPDSTPAQIVTASLGANAISNIGLFVYLEQNKEICDALMSEVMTKGITMKVPFVTTYKSNLAGGGVNISQNITSAQGEKVMFIAWTAYNNAESGATAKDHTVYPFLATTYQTTLNSIPIVTNNLINVATGDHYIYNKDSIDGSAITNLPAYNQQFVHFDNFTGMTLPELQKNLNTEVGIPCSSSTVTWGLSVGNAGSQLNYYVYFVTQKTLSITPGNVVVSIQG